MEYLYYLKKSWLLEFRTNIKVCVYVHFLKNKKIQRMVHFIRNLAESPRPDLKLFTGFSLEFTPHSTSTFYYSTLGRGGILWKLNYYIKKEMEEQAVRL